jgi:hypothetical protein
MRRVTTAWFVASATLATSCVAIAGSNSIGVTVTSDRNSNRFSVPENMKYQLDAGHAFDNGLTLGGSFQYTDPAFSESAIQNLEGTIGYGVPLISGFSLNGSAGIGERWHQSPSTSFPYYVLRIGLDFAINQDLAWNVISYRFRDAFDTSDNYNTPQVATGLTFKLDAQSSISAKVMRNWKDGERNSTGVSLGFDKKF